MIHFDIDDRGKEDLKEFLQHCLNFLKLEIHHTDTRAFRERLKQKEKAIENLLDQLGPEANG